MTATQLQAWRDKRGLTQQQLADLLGVSRYTVQAWELGRNPLSPFLHLALKELERHGHG